MNADTSAVAVTRELALLPICSRFCGEDVCRCDAARAFWKAVAAERDRLAEAVRALDAAHAQAAREVERLREAVALGAEMRAKQAAYFKTRGRDELVASKDAERAFDRAARAALAGEK